MTSRAPFNAARWEALVRYNPRVLTPPADWLGTAEWREAGIADVDGEGARLQPVAIKVVGLEPGERAAVRRAAAPSGVTVSVGRQGPLAPALIAGPRPAVEAFIAALPDAGCEALSGALSETLTASDRDRFRLALPGEVLDVGARPLVMGVVNVTPDSFSDGGRFLDRGAAIAQGQALSEAGADLIDVGGESTRPGSAPVEAADELRRVLPVVAALAAAGVGAVSIDTSKAEVAAECVRAGAVMVNDVTALFGDPAMAETVADLNAAVCVMHRQGTPRTMQVDPRYDDLMGEITAFLRRSMARGLGAGIEEDRFLVDPGIGFGKAVAHNLVILNRLAQLRSLGRPLLVGPSRKSFIGTVLADEAGDRPVDRRRLGTAAAVAAAIERGAHIVRVHDVGDMRDVARIVDAIQNEGVTTPGRWAAAPSSAPTADG